MKRKAILEFTGGDRAKTTQLLDWEMEHAVEDRYEKWAERMAHTMQDCGDEEGSRVFWGLFRELCYDGKQHFDEGYKRHGCIIGGPSPSDGTTYPVECHDPFAPMWEGDPQIINLVAESEKTCISCPGHGPETGWLGTSKTKAQPLQAKPFILEMLDSLEPEQSTSPTEVRCADVDVD